MAPPAVDPRARFREEVRRATRTTGIAAGVVAMVGFPAWTGFDYLVEPDRASEFLLIRLGGTAVLAGFWALFFTDSGRRHPEAITLAILATVEVAIAVMISRLDDSYAGYALGLSLPLYGSAFLLIWPPAYTAALVGVGLVTMPLAWLAAGSASAAAVATVAFYLVTAATISLIGQYFRQRAAWDEFRARTALEAEQRRSEELVAKLDRLSHEDALTGLANRRAWDEALERECARAARGGHTLSVVLCDVDRLKEINDGFGHAMGDVVLRAVGDLFEERARGADLVARFGGDEFGILSSGTDESGAASLAEDLRRLLEERQPGGPAIGPVTISVGIAEWDGSDDSAATLMMRADRRLYTAKARRNVVCAGDPSSLA